MQWIHSTGDTKIIFGIVVSVNNRFGIRIQTMNVKEMKLTDFLPILLCGLTIPISLIMWMGNVLYANWSQNGEDGKW